MKLDPFLYYIYKSSQNVFNLNVISETINLLEENIGSILLDIGLSNYFLDLIPKTKATKEKINKWDYINLKGFLPFSLRNHQQMKRHPSYVMRENICRLYI